MKILLSIVLLWISVPCMAQTTFQWDYAVTEEVKITGFHAWQTKNCGNYGGLSPVGTIAPNLREHTLPDPPKYGKWCYSWTAFFQDGTEITESDFSNEVNKTFRPPKVNNLAIKTAAAIITAPVKGVTKLAGLFKGKKNLRIVG